MNKIGLLQILVLLFLSVVTVLGQSREYSQIITVNDYTYEIEVFYRAAGEDKWLTAMPLVRIPAGSTRNRTRPTYTWKKRKKKY